MTPAFIYKIFSGYDGFTPRRIPERMDRAMGTLALGWERYIDSVEVGSECWIYFHGPHRFTPGVYATGFVSKVLREQAKIVLRLRKYAVDEPLVKGQSAYRISAIVAPRFRQVFLRPADWDSPPECGPASCGMRQCRACETWRNLRLIEPGALQYPERLDVERVKSWSPAYWAIPPRCYLFKEGKQPHPWIRRGSDMFYDFKLGEGRYAFPLSLGIYHALCSRNLTEFDAIVPIPLSPGKIEAQEINRTLLLAHELAKLLGPVPVRPMLLLRDSISKRAMLAAGYATGDFERAYSTKLCVTKPLLGAKRLLLIDDTCTRGSTLTQAARKLMSVEARYEIHACAATQMVVKAVVADEGRLTQ